MWKDYIFALTGTQNKVLLLLECQTSKNIGSISTMTIRQHPAIVHVNATTGVLFIIVWPCYYSVTYGHESEMVLKNYDTSKQKRNVTFNSKSFQYLYFIKRKQQQLRKHFSSGSCIYCTLNPGKKKKGHCVHKF